MRLNVSSTGSSVRHLHRDQAPSAEVRGCHAIMHDLQSRCLHFVHTAAVGVDRHVVRGTSLARCAEAAALVLESRLTVTVAQLFQRFFCTRLPY